MNNLLANVFPGTQKLVETSLLLPLHNIVLMPGITLPILATQSHIIGVAEATALSPRKQLVITAVRPEIAEKFEAGASLEIESIKDIYPIATLAEQQHIAHLSIGQLELLVRGLVRVKIESIRLIDHIYEVKFQRLPKLTKEAAIESGISPTIIQALMQAIQSLWREIASIYPNFSDEVLELLSNGNNPVELAYQTATLLQLDVQKQQAILEQENVEQLLHQVLDVLSQELEVQRLRGKILGETKKKIDEQQREFFLRQQMKKIQEQLGESDTGINEIAELKNQMGTANLPEAAFKQAKRELARLERVGSDSAEGGVIRTYLDWLLEMPWSKALQDNLDLRNARKVLDTDHHGLNKVKERIIEHLATFKLRVQGTSQESINSGTSPSPHPPISSSSVGTVMCFVGPPGVGKTSLGHSIARALGRPFERISLGGLRDEAELRGHRRTYIGAMPGRIIQALHRCGVNNPVVMLDELDKVGMDYRGDPASVLLEILDPQQNYCFRDLYLDLDFDLSQIFFIGTANDLSKVPTPLLDRLEIIELSGYSDQEKLMIAEKYLLPRQLEKAGLPNNAVQLTSSVLQKVVEYYTREAGVRRLEQHLGSLCRKVAVRYADGNTEPVVIYPEQLEDLLGAKIFLHDELRKAPHPGVATGLAWTLAGGEVLFVEAVLLPQGEELTLTGQLGEVMEESARIAYSYIWSNAQTLGIDTNTFKHNGLHIHVPAGAVPKDGPSAGVTMVTAIASLLTKKPVRIDTAMTGEVNLSGEVLPVGGIREKVLAAHRAGIKRVLLPQQNAKDLVDVPQDVSSQLEFIFCESIKQVLNNTLLFDI